MCSNKSGVDYVVVKINGVDINQMPKCEAVQTFLQTKGPIVVELCRRTSSDCDVGRGSIDLEKLRISTDDSKLNKSKSVSASPNQKNKTTTYEIKTCQSHAASAAAASHDNELVLTLQTNGMCSMVKAKASDEVTTQQQTKAADLVFLTSQQTQTDDPTCVVVNAQNAQQQHEMARKLADRFIEQEHHLFEQCLEPEIDIEEVTLIKNGVGDCKELLGLTVCYSGSTVGSSSAGGSSVAGNNNNNIGGGVAGVQNSAAADDNESACTEVFISDIQPNSVAERDGRLRRGDQILQINGNDIKSREDTELLLAESSNSLTLLVSRYLYAEDEASEDDDDDDEEYYVDNNLAYANGFIVNDYTNVVDKLDRALTLEKQTAATKKVPPPNNVEQVDCSVTPTDTNADGAGENKMTSAQSQSIKKAQHNVKSTTTKSSEMKSTLQDAKEKSGDVVRPSDVNSTLAVLSNCSARKYEYDDTEHIYETIPEDSESEPFYCSPYQSSTYMTAVGSCSSATDALELQQQKQRVAQWLGIKSNAVSMHTIAATTPAVRLSFYGGGNRTATTMSQRTANKICTMRSAVTNTTSGSSSSGGAGGTQAIGDSTINPIDELENSSSAYNTGGSNNSASPLALALNKNHQQPTAGGQVDIDSAGGAKNRVGNQTILNKTQRLQSPKEQTITSPKNIIIAPFGKSFVADNIVRNKSSVDDAQTFSKTLYRNETNSYQAAMLQQQQQQQYFRNTAGHQHQQRQLEQPMTSSQFNAPNLSQYHFVSSQEVATSTMNVNTASPKITLPTEVANKIADDEATPMVWKVKRRPDGTRYIVRRPAARNRLPCVRRTIRNYDITTTEDDTISEVKIGRYWTKEERKRHIERARERRQQQQQQQQQQQLQ